MMDYAALCRSGLALLSTALIVSVAAAPLANATQLPELLPIDESAKCPGFVAFKARLSDIVRRRDPNVLLEVLHPKISFSFGPGSPGREGFMSYWFEDRQPTDPDVWTELSDLLRLGGRCHQDSFRGPYVSTEWPDQFDSLDFAAIIGERVRVRERPSGTSRVIGLLSYSIVRLARESDGPWEGITLPDGRDGYVSRRFLRSPIDIRATFVRQDGLWWITSFVGGD